MKKVGRKRKITEAEKLSALENQTFNGCRVEAAAAAAAAAAPRVSRRIAGLGTEVMPARSAPAAALTAAPAARHQP